MKQNGEKMNIDKALKHFEYKFTNVWKPSKHDIEAFNSLLDWKELQEQQTLQRNESFAKLWIHQLMLLNNTELYSAERSIQVIDEILDKSVYEWVTSLKDQLNIMRFNTVLNDDNYKDAVRHGNISKMRETGYKIVLNNEKQLTDMLQKEVKEENVIKFVQNQINRIINTYEK